MKQSFLRQGVVTVLAGAALLATRARAADDPDSPAYWQPAQQELAALADGFLVWESRRNADHNWSIWTIQLDGTGLRQLTPAEPGRFQLSPQISPDGTRVAYLSFPAQPNEHADAAGGKVPLHLINRDGTGDRIVVDDARNYSGWDRGVLWFNDNEIAFIAGADGNTYRLNLTTGEKTLLIERGGGDNPSWLPSPDLTGACWSFNTFSLLDAKTHRVTPMPHLGGCQPYYTADSRWGFWMKSIGGPIGRMYLPTRAVSVLLDGSIMPCGRRFVYFPMVSDNQRLLAFAGLEPAKLIGGYCGGEESDYDIFVIQIDPRTLDVVGKPIRYSFDPKTDRFPDVWQAEPALGYQTDKVPFDVSFAPKGGGEWQWDFGDGATAKGAVGKHSYTRPGIYTVRATQAERKITGQVRLLPATPPQATGAMVEGDREIVVAFNEPVNLGAAKLDMQSKARIEKWTAGEDGRSLRVLLADKLRASDTLVLDGLTDKAQHPNPMAAARLGVVPRVWPVNPDGLVYLWQNGKLPNRVRDPMTGEMRAYEFDRRDRTWLDHNYALVLDGGMVTVRNFYDDYSNAVRKSGQFTWEATLTPRDLAGERQAVISYGLWQVKDKLVLASQGNIELFAVEAGKPHHVVVTYGGGKVSAWLNGKEVFSTSDPKLVLGNLNGVGSGPLSFGNSLDNQPWHGTIEGVAIYNRALAAEEIKANAAAYLNLIAARKPVEHFEIEGKLLAASKIPTVKEIAPYTQGLAVFEYEVQKVLAGKYAAKTVRVAHWVILDRETQRISQLAKGASAHLLIENIAENPQLEGNNTTDALGANPDLPLFVAVEGTQAQHYGVPAWNVLGGEYAAADALKVVHERPPGKELPAGQAGPAWKILTPNEDGIVRGGGLHVVYVVSPDERKVILSARSVGGLYGFVNGASVINEPKDFRRYPFCGKRQYATQLRKGVNELVFLVPGLHGQTHFCCDLLDPNAKEMPDLRYETRVADPAK